MFEDYFRFKKKMVVDNVPFKLFSSFLKFSFDDSGD